MIIKFVKNNQPAGVGCATKHYSGLPGSAPRWLSVLAPLRFSFSFLSLFPHFFLENQVENNEDPRMKR